MKYVITRIDGGAPIPTDEPCFILRGQDVLTALMIEEYLRFYQHSAPNPDPEVVDQLTALLLLVKAWPRKKWAGAANERIVSDAQAVAQAEGGK